MQRRKNLPKHNGILAEDVRSLGPPDTSGTSVLIRFLSVLEGENFTIMQINQDN